MTKTLPQIAGIGFGSFSNDSCDPEWKDLLKKIEKIEKLRENRIPTIPSTLKEELDCNIFLRAKDVETFSKLRDFKDNF